MRKKKHPILILVMICLLLILVIVACQSKPDSEPTAGTPAADGTYKIQFMVGDTVYSEQSLRPGQKAEAVSPAVDGLQFLYWTDSTGAKVQPETVAARSSAVYTAVGYPALSNHVPFLFVNEAGLLSPEDAISKNEVQMAFNALATPAAADFFPRMPAGEEEFTLAELKELALHFFPGDAVNAATSEMQDGSLIRSDFAAIMCRLLGRGEGEKFQIAKGALPAMDLGKNTKNLTALLEASLPHTPAENGTTWEQFEMPSGKEPGFYNKDGYLYYVKRDGYLLRDGKVGSLYFGKDGRYTSGDRELDDLVANILDKLIKKNPGKSRYDILYQAHLYCRDTFDYLRKPTYKMGATGWEIKDAKEVFTTNLGNCYNYAAAFWSLARGLGYEATAVSGETHCNHRVQAHAWVFLEKGGKTYICDCEWEMVYRVRQNRFDMNMFMIPIEKCGYWSYVWKK